MVNDAMRKGSVFLPIVVWASGMGYALLQLGWPPALCWFVGMLGLVKMGILSLKFHKLLLKVSPPEQLDSFRGNMIMVMRLHAVLTRHARRVKASNAPSSQGPSAVW